MDQNMLTLALIAATLVLWILKRNATGGAKRISPEEVKKKLDTEKGIMLVDVRTKGEYQQKHIPKSISIPLNVLANEAGRKLPDKNAEIIVYCMSGSRSASAARTLTKLGYTNIYNLGGIVRWPYKTVSGK